MKDDHSISDETWALVDALLSERISDSELRLLETTLRENPNAQQEFLEYCQLHVNLHANIRSQRVVDRFCSEALDATPSEIAIADNAPSVMQSGGRSRRLDKSRYSRLFAIGGCLLLVLLAAYEFGHRRGSDASSGQALHANTSDSLTPLAVKNTLRLDSGVAKFSIENVGYVVLEGPAEFELLNPMRARLKSGRIKMHVTEASGHGFVVETPYGDVTDQGTEFGLDLTEQGKAGLVVFEGQVDLRVAEADSTTKYLPAKLEHLVEGDGVSFEKGGKIDRISSITTGTSSTFRQDRAEAVAGEQQPIIVRVKDSMKETRKFYEIVPGGLREDCPAFVDRPYEWNGATANGIPQYLVGADYVKSCNSKDRLNPNLKVQVTLSQPARLYVFFNEDFEAPEWVKRDFHHTGDKIGLDQGQFGVDAGRFDRLGVGPGVSIDGAFDVWELVVPSPTTVTLGDRGESWPTMYGIAAVKLEPDPEQNRAAKQQQN